MARAGASTPGRCGRSTGSSWWGSSIDPARGAAAGAELGVPAFATVAGLLARVEAGLVVLATPASGRLALVESILEGRGVRALVLEKPMALRLAEAHRVLGLCE